MSKRRVYVFADVDIRDFLSAEGNVNFARYLAEGQRVGQAFMNAADNEIYGALTGSLFDPFYKDDASDVVLAMDFLTRV